ncbi:carbohydrate ABC transporter permease [Garciella nitratireducens]|uniref:carbohydrate ABC transporter permease n=1 Tax=Garciella nitratireducens TaxID=218205 RepID=UPI000DEB1110|nr:ABC transporter permease subunit [Garciella nitratireducens]RBP46696.1 arabinogalactan oligomer/maltooligosaccharide transport system permease protein [Garciella nitratireducens]
MEYNKFLYDEFGNIYERKNLYLKEIVELNEKIKEANPNEKNYLRRQQKELIKKGEEHPYNIKFKKFKESEKNFIKSLKKKKKDFINQLDQSLPYKVKKLKIECFIAQEKYNFYKKYIDLTYDAQFEYEKNRILMKELPPIIESIVKETKAVQNAIKDRKNIDLNQEKKIELEFKKFKKEQKKALKLEQRKLKEKRKKGLISRKAQINENKILKQKYKEAVLLKSYDCFEKRNKEFIKNKKHEIKQKTKLGLKEINFNIADRKKRIPIELEKNKVKIAYFTLLFPGVGQILNSQYKKGILFLIATFFIYFIAIPYALGFGNYQGEGIKGLITLAEGGRRVDKSLIFMIEGIIAIFLLIISLFLLYFSFKDVLKVEKNKIKGIRPKNWFEIKSSFQEEGFPYIANLPGLIVIVFIILVPVTTTILLSFTGMDPQHQSKFYWIGIQNYKLIFLGQGLAGSVFWLTLGWTIVWTLVATTLAIIIGFILALLVNQDRIKGKAFFRTVYLLPWAVPAFITIMFFSIMLSPNGAISQLIQSIWNIEISVKTDAMQTRIALILLQGWLGSSYIFLLSTGVLQAIPNDLYEAAEMDGATTWQKLKHITIPIVLFQTAPLLIGQYVFNFNNFSIIYLFNGGGPFEPTLYGNLAGSSDLLISYIYKLTIENQYQGIGAAITVFVSIAVMFVSFLGYRNSKAFKEERL